MTRRCETCEVCGKADRCVQQWLGHVDYADGPELCDMCADRCSQVAKEQVCEDRDRKTNSDLFDAAFVAEAVRLRADYDADTADNARPEPDDCHTSHLRPMSAGPAL